MSVTDSLLRNNERYASSFSASGMPAAPARRIAVVTCMDARLDVSRILGLREGDAHVIRNAGGVATDDVIRSLLISQRLLGTVEVVVIQHTACGMQTFTDDELKQQLEAEIGFRPHFALEAFPDPETGVRLSLERILASPFVARRESVRGFVYDVETGRLREIAAS